MKLLRSLLLGTAVTAMLPLLPVPTVAAHAATTVTAASNARLIVRFKATAVSVRTKALSANASASDAATTTQGRALSLGQRMGVTLAGGRAVDERTQVVTAIGIDAPTLLKRLSQDAEVEWVAVDQRRKHYAAPNDPLFETVPAGNGGPVSGQWYLKAPDATAGPAREGGNIASSINAVGAWDRTTGSTSIVVAVLDSGVRYDHPDLVGKLLPGYDMIEQVLVSNDGNGRDDDANDPGDWLTSAEKGTDFYKDCEVENSSWHGTQVAGLIGASTNNNVGMAGVSWGSKILPVRVLGKCGGYDSDIVAGMKWAAGVVVPGSGLPVNPNPARVLNMSLGGVGTCQGAGTPELYREAMTAITAKGAVVVVAAGNSTGHAINLPANCPGVVGVVALRHIGTKVGFSDIGPEVTIAAPGGNCVNIGPGDPCMYPMLSTYNAGTTAPDASNYTDSFRAAYGTSFSAPLVSGTIALMLSQKPSLAPAEVISLLKSTARAFPSSNIPNDPVKQCVAPNGIDQLECYCTTTTCGAGMLDASAAVAAVTTAAQARITSTPATPQAGDAIQLSASTSAAATGRTIAGYAWTLVSGGGIVSGFSSATNASTAALAAATGAGTVTVRLQITDDQGAATSSEASITVAAAPVVVPPVVTPPATSSGGGGAMGWGWLLGLALAVLGLARQRRVS